MMTISFVYDSSSGKSKDKSAAADSAVDVDADDAAKPPSDCLSSYFRLQKTKVKGMLSKGHPHPTDLFYNHTKLTLEEAEQVRLLGIYMMSKLGQDYWLYCNGGPINKVTAKISSMKLVDWLEEAESIEKEEERKRAEEAAASAQAEQAEKERRDDGADADDDDLMLP
jgi:hypothetical protein